jgi:RNA-directed DNA polymerase
MSLLDELVDYVGLSRSDLLRVINTAPVRYKTYEIPKRNGGVRVIAQPSKELKAIQRYILENKLRKLPMHRSALAYEPKTSIYKNAYIHRNSEYLLKLDFKDFFPSIRVKDWRAYYSKCDRRLFEQSDFDYYAKILFWSAGKKSLKPICLSIGAPTSPTLSNALMKEFDEYVFNISQLNNTSYSRYADDIFISGSVATSINIVESLLYSYVRDLKSPNLSFNKEKRVFVGKGSRRTVTGLNITPNQTLSIGRSRKRMISSLVHRHTLGELNEDETEMLKGFLSFALANEPEFIERLRNKYTEQIISRIFRGNLY